MVRRDHQTDVAADPFQEIAHDLLVYLFYGLYLLMKAALVRRLVRRLYMHIDDIASLEQLQTLCGLGGVIGIEVPGCARN